MIFSQIGNYTDAAQSLLRRTKNEVDFTDLAGLRRAGKGGRASPRERMLVRDEPKLQTTSARSSRMVLGKRIARVLNFLWPHCV